MDSKESIIDAIFQEVDRVTARYGPVAPDDWMRLRRPYGGMTTGFLVDQLESMRKMERWDVLTGPDRQKLRQAVGRDGSIEVFAVTMNDAEERELREYADMVIRALAEERS